MSYKLLTVDKEKPLPVEVAQLRKLLTSLISICIRDVQQYIKNPEKTEKFLRKYGDCIEYSIEFLKECGSIVLFFLVGYARGKTFYQKILQDINKAEEIYRRRQN